MKTPNHATPDELRIRAKAHIANWRRLLPFSPLEAREELEKASTLALLAGEADAANDNDQKGRAA